MGQGVDEGLTMLTESMAAKITEVKSKKNLHIIENVLSSSREEKYLCAAFMGFASLLLG